MRSTKTPELNIMQPSPGVIVESVTQKTGAPPIARTERIHRTAVRGLGLRGGTFDGLEVQRLTVFPHSELHCSAHDAGYFRALPLSNKKWRDEIGAAERQRVSTLTESSVPISASGTCSASNNRATFRTGQGRMINPNAQVNIDEERGVLSPTPDKGSSNTQL